MKLKYGIYINRNKNYKNKLNILIKKLIHIVDVNEEISINNKIKHISDFISSLLKIKRTLIGQKNNDNLEQLPK